MAFLQTFLIRESRPVFWHKEELMQIQVIQTKYSSSVGEKLSLSYDHNSFSQGYAPFWDLG